MDKSSGKGNNHGNVPVQMATSSREQVFDLETVGSNANISPLVPKPISALLSLVDQEEDTIFKSKKIGHEAKSQNNANNKMILGLHHVKSFSFRV